MAIKLSPGVDYERIASLDAEIEVISEAGECKQAVAWCGRLRRGLRRATMLPSGDEIAIDGAGGLAPPEIREPREGDILVEPDAAIIRSGLVGELARRRDLHGIDPRLAYLVGERPVERAFGISLRIVELGPWSLRAARSRLRAHDVGRVDIKTRGFAASPEELARQLRPSGAGHAVLVVTRLRERPVFAICRTDGA